MRERSWPLHGYVNPAPARRPLPDARPTNYKQSQPRTRRPTSDLSTFIRKMARRNSWQPPQVSMRSTRGRAAGLREVQQPPRGDRGQSQGAAAVHPAGEGGAGGAGGVDSNGGDGDNRNANDNGDDTNGNSRPVRDRTGSTGQETEAKVSPHQRKRKRLSPSFSLSLSLSLSFSLSIEKGPKLVLVLAG